MCENKIKALYPVDAFQVHCLIRLGNEEARGLQLERMVALISEGYGVQPMEYPHDSQPVESGSPLLSRQAVEEWLGSLDRIWNNPVAFCPRCWSPVTLVDEETSTTCLKCKQEWSCGELIASPRGSEASNGTSFDSGGAETRE